MPPAAIRRATIEVPFALGIDQSQEDSLLPEGVLKTCKNWIPEVSGGLRARTGWIAGPNTKDAGEAEDYPTTKKVRGMFYVTDWVTALAARKRWWVLCMIDNSGNEEIWATKHDLTGGWHHLGQHANIDSEYPVAFGKAQRDLYFTNPGMTDLRRWTLDESTDSVNVGSMTEPGQAMAFHKERLYCGGAYDFPYRLYYSALANGASWDVANDYIDIGSDDGAPICDLLAFGDQLVIAKSTEVWIMIGDPEGSFSLTQLEGVAGSRGRCLVATPKGLVILGEESAWLWQGGDPEPISRPVQSTYIANIGDTVWKTGVYAGGYVFVAGSAAAQPLLVFDLDRGVWWTEPTDSDDDQMISIWARDNRLVGGPRQSTVASPLNYRDVRTGARAKDLSTMAETFEAQTGDMWITKNRERVLITQIHARVRQRSGTAASNDLTITPYIDGVAQDALTLDARGGSNPQVFRKRLPWAKKTGRAIGVKVSTTVPSGGGAVYDIEGALQIDVEISPAAD